MGTFRHPWSSSRTSHTCCGIRCPSERRGSTLLRIECNLMTPLVTESSIQSNWQLSDHWQATSRFEFVSRSSARIWNSSSAGRDKWRPTTNVRLWCWMNGKLGSHGDRNSYRNCLSTSRFTSLYSSMQKPWSLIVTRPAATWILSMNSSRCSYSIVLATRACCCSSPRTWISGKSISSSITRQSTSSGKWCETTRAYCSTRSWWFE